MQDFRKTCFFLFNLDLTALDAAHIQYIVDQTQQVFAGCEYFTKIVFHLLLIAAVGDRQGCKTDDCIHRRSNIMGHIVQECSLCNVRMLRFSKSLLQNRLLFQLLADNVVYIPESDQDKITSVAAASVLCQVCYTVVLVNMYCIVAQYTIGSGIFRAGSYFFHDSVQRKSLCQLLSVLGKNPIR